MKYEEARTLVDQGTSVEGDLVRYTGVTFDATDPLRPWIPIVVRFPWGLNSEALAIVDTGADETFLPWRMVAPSGLRWDDLLKAGEGDLEKFAVAFGGDAQAFRRLDAGVYWNGQLVNDRPAVFHPDRAHADPVLGLGDLSKFDIGFRWGDEPPTFSLTPTHRG